MKYFCLIAACLLVAVQSNAEDRITFKSGNTITGKVLHYSNGILHVQTQSGKVKKGKISAVKRIEFDGNRNIRSNTGRNRIHTGRGSDIKKASEVIDNAGSWNGKMMKLSGYISEVSDVGMNNDIFEIILQCGLHIQLNRDSFESKYLELKNLDHTFEYHYDDIRYEVNFSNLADFEPAVRLYKIHGDYDYGDNEWDEETINRTDILSSGTKIRCRGKIVKKANETVMKNCRLLYVE